ncbi:hypothetical protein MRX96_048231 [Rhipicephalus microplus]
MHACHNLSGKNKGYIVTMTKEGKSVPVQVDTDGTVTGVLDEVYRSTFQHVKREPTVFVLKTNTGAKMIVLQECDMKMQCVSNKQSYQLVLCMMLSKNYQFF